MRCWLVFFLWITSIIAFAQPASPDLNQDPVFTTVIKRRLTYPRQAEWSSVYGRFFAEFSVDAKGRIQNISMLNSSPKGTYYGFEPTIRAALKKLPSLNLHYKGSYILPVSFIFVDYRHKDKPFVPQDTLFIQDLAGRIILKEINVLGSSANSRERIIAAQKNEPY